MKDSYEKIRERWMRTYHSIQGHVYDIDGNQYRFKHLAKEGKLVDLWFDSSETEQFTRRLPHSEFIIDIADAYRSTNEIDFDDVLIVNIKDKNDNWFYPDDKVWALTISAVSFLLRDFLVNKNISTKEFDEYLKKENVKGVWEN